ncbi:DUF485 domain-containing protein [Mycolicibacterium hippocampi]|uniref:DUF485 domain-containing protein n=1 Tax=Mycolicibacterium hippocampi TaxID=659824 RepID=A0A7I9ZFI3_9MYCO|nr:DUF485 domain-containing protein [Mycolicibacterium hippocampi]GFG99789.1 hypothetical protein MHIP_02730 [Mycolicibacterium hippocampi]
MPDATSPESAYRETARRRQRLQVSLVTLVLGYYFATVTCVNFTSILDGAAVGAITWAYVATYSQFVVAVIVTIVYRNRIGAIERKFAHSSSAPHGLDR